MAQLVNSLAEDKKVSSFSPVLFAQLMGFMLVFGWGLLLIALVWILAYKRSLMWTDSILTEMSSYLTGDLAQIKAVRKSPVRISPVSLLIPASFWAIYSWFGLSLRQTVLFHWYNMIFDADIPLMIPKLTQWGGDNERHPLLALLFSPFGIALDRLLHSPEAATVIVNAFAGALTIWLIILIQARLE